MTRLVRMSFSGLAITGVVLVATNSAPARRPAMYARLMAARGAAVIPIPLATGAQLIPIPLWKGSLQARLVVTPADAIRPLSNTLER